MSRPIIENLRTWPRNLNTAQGGALSMSQYGGLSTSPGGGMKEDCKSLRRQIKRLNKDISFLKCREQQNRKREAEKSELRYLLAGVRLFMLRLMQGHVPFRVVAEHLACKVDQEELRKLYDTALKQPRHLSRRALTMKSLYRTPLRSSHWRTSVRTRTMHISPLASMKRSSPVLPRSRVQWRR